MKREGQILSRYERQGIVKGHVLQVNHGKTQQYYAVVEVVVKGAEERIEEGPYGDPDMASYNVSNIMDDVVKRLYGKR